MNKYITLVNEFQEGNNKGIYFIENQLKKHLNDNNENQDEIESILDFLYSNKDIDITQIGYKTILEKTDKWHKKLQNVSDKDSEIEGVDYEVIKDFGDGFKFVKLISKSCYDREGKMMSHCVSSYFGRDCKIYSLRDNKNLPHCTIEEDRQIKGKGNGSIDPKYVKYVVEFLEELGMKVGENEMKNLGYHKLDSIDIGLTCDSLYNGYVYSGNIESIKDRNGNKYQGTGLFKIKKLVELKSDYSLKWNFDIDSIIKYSTSYAYGRNN